MTAYWCLGEIAHLCEIASPDIAIVTNTLDAHIGEFGGFNNLVKAKGEIYSNHFQGIFTRTWIGIIRVINKG
jgi:UDP-N-acetylmuramoyl-tripeptide--D-alanyl-D-alanine ligase